MATPKKTSVKKPAATKTTPKKAVAKPATHKTVAKKTPVHTTTKKAASAKTHSKFVSLTIVPDDQPFFTFRVTRQSLYWLIFSATILALGLWVLNLNMQIVSLYDQIDNTNAQTSMSTPAPHSTQKTVKK
jgi:hypothetical protein